MGCTGAGGRDKDSQGRGQLGMMLSPDVTGVGTAMFLLGCLWPLGQEEVTRTEQPGTVLSPDVAGTGGDDKDSQGSGAVRNNVVP